MILLLLLLFLPVVFISPHSQFLGAIAGVLGHIFRAWNQGRDTALVAIEEQVTKRDLHPNMLSKVFNPYPDYQSPDYIAKHGEIGAIAGVLGHIFRAWNQGRDTALVAIEEREALPLWRLRGDNLDGSEELAMRTDENDGQKEQEQEQDHEANKVTKRPPS
jgi:hypothetical protein